MANIIHKNHLPAQVKYHPKIPLGPPFYDTINSTMSFVKHQKAEEEKRRRGGKSKTEEESQILCCLCLKFDLPLFWKVSEIKPDKSLSLTTGVEFQVRSWWKSQIIELGPRPSLKKAVFLANLYKIEIMITSLKEIIELPNFSHMTTSTT